MTILFFTRRFYPLIGGVEKHVLEIGKRLVKKGAKVIVITEYENNTNKENQQLVPLDTIFEGIEIIRIEVGAEGRYKKFRIWLELLRHIKVISSANIVHCHDIFFWYLPFRFIFLNKPVYTTFHGYEGNNMPNKKSIFMHRLAEKLSWGNICVGDFFKKWYYTKPTIVTYGAVNYIYRGKEKSYDKNLIIFVGRLEEETGIMEYLKAFNEIQKKYKKLKLVVLGDGSQMSKAKEFVENNKLNVEFKGFVKNIGIDLERASFVFVSRYLGILESLMSKKFVLAVYNNKIKKDYLQMTPFARFISISKNSNEISNQLERYILNEKEKEFKVNKGYNWVKNQTWEEMVSIYLKLWKM